jgi:hypothetical protein
VIAASTDPTTDWASVVNAVLNTLQTIALAYFAARWKPNGK